MSETEYVGRHRRGRRTSRVVFNSRLGIWVRTGRNYLVVSVIELRA